MGRSPGFGSNPDNLPDIMETPPPISVPRGPAPDESDDTGFVGRPPAASSPPGYALLGLAFAVAPELLFLNRAA